MKSVLSFTPKAGVFSMSASRILSTSETESTTIPIMTEPPEPATSTTMMQVRSVYAAASRLNRRRRSTTGMTFPRRLMTPLTNSGVWGTGVMFIIPMISLTFRIPIPYSSPASEKVRYLPSFAGMPAAVCSCRSIVSVCMSSVPPRAS